MYRNAFGYEEDTLLSIALHNLLVFMLMVGVDKDETLEMCQRMSARTRLATAEEKLLQQTLHELEVPISLVLHTLSFSLHMLSLSTPSYSLSHTLSFSSSELYWLCGTAQSGNSTPLQ